MILQCAGDDKVTVQLSDFSILGGRSFWLSEHSFLFCELDVVQVRGETKPATNTSEYQPRGAGNLSDLQVFPHCAGPCHNLNILLVHSYVADSSEATASADFLLTIKTSFLPSPTLKQKQYEPRLYRGHVGHSSSFEWPLRDGVRACGVD